MKSRHVFPKRMGLFFLVTWAFINMLNAQTSVSSPEDVLPPAPNAAAISKNGEMGLNKNSGSPSLSIPLFTISGSKLSVPLSLSYSTNGIKVDEIASRAGMGWILNAGGVVTRTVRHIADGRRPRRGSPWAFVGTNWATYNFIKGIMQGSNTDGFDSEPDLFHFNMNGYSGSFVLDDNMNVMMISRSDLKVSYTLDTLAAWNFRITTPDGVAYYFGGGSATEKTRRTSVCGKSFYDAFTATAWYLVKIVHPTGEEIVFNYAPINYTYETGMTQTMYYVFPRAIEFQPPCSDICPTPPTSTCTNLTHTLGVVLKSIVAPGKSMVKLYYSPRQDCSDSLVSRVDWIDPRNNKLRGSYQLIYQTVAANLGYENGNRPGHDKTPYLRELKSRPADAAPSLSHYFSYIDPAGRPPRLSYSQDHWGFFNGKGNASFVPKPDNKILYGSLQLMRQFPAAVADREPDSAYVAKGLLKLITYPTGGTDSIAYESNRMLKAVNDNPYRNISSSVTGTGLRTMQYVDSAFTLDQGQEIEISINCVDNSGTGAFDSLHNKGAVEIYLNGTDGPISFLVYPGTNTYHYTDIPGGTHRLRVIANGSVTTTNVVLTYKPVNTLTTRNVISAGVRVKSITSYARGGTPAVKRYYYGTLDSLFLSSMTDQSLPIYFAQTTMLNFCAGIEFTKCETSYLHSNSVNSLADYQSGMASYRAVVESHGENFENGGVESKFFTSVDGIADVLYGRDFVTSAKSNYSSAFNSKLLEETIFKKNTAGSLLPVQKTMYSYTLDARAQKKVDAFNASSNITLSVVMPSTDFDTTDVTSEFYPGHTYLSIALKYANLKRYRILGDWVYASKVTTYHYDEAGGNPLTNAVNYFYDSLSHTQLTRTETQDSKGATIKTLYSNPYNLRGTAVYDSMISRNILPEQIITRKYRNDSLITTLTRNYGFFNSGKVELLSRTTAWQHSPPEVDVSFDAYDASGNLLQFTGKDGLATSFLWSYNGSFPIAKTVNATHGSVAAESFEAESTGTWDFNSIGITSDYGAVTGMQAFTLSTGNIQRNGLLASQTYVVTFWLKDGGTASVNGASATSLLSKNGWTLFRKEVTGQSSVGISGSGVIDEVRIYPGNAQMTTYTYSPLIGITSQCDANNRITYYEYDGLGRLTVVRDQNKHIVQQYCYNYYTNHSVPCVENPPSIDPEWTPSGNTRCVKNSGYNTGEQEREEIDNNSNSPGYNQNRWVSAGTNTTACPVSPDWEDLDNYRCVKAEGVYTGYREQEQRDKNPVTANANRWKSLGYTGACVPNWIATGETKCVTNAGYNTGDQLQREYDNNTNTASGYRWVTGTNTTACPVTPAWTATGNYRCVTVNGYNNGSQEQEQQDLNPVTHSGTRWVNIGYTGSCPMLPVWKATGNYRCATVNNFNSGSEEQEEEDINPFTAYGTRWVDLGVTGSCPVTPAWTATGNYRCATTAGFVNGHQEQEQHDINPFTSYGTRWVDLGVNGSCAVTPAWTATGNYRCVTVNGYNNGSQEQEQQDLNPVTHSGTRWVNIGYTGSCPMLPVWKATGNYRCATVNNFNSGSEEQEEEDINPFTAYGTRWVDLGVTGSCAVTPAWTATGNYRCATTAGFVNGHQEQEQHDINPFTAYGTRWVDLGVNGNCPVTPAWTATGNYRCVTVNGYNNGLQEQEQQDLNPVTHNGTRWVNIGYTGSCPMLPVWKATGNYRCTAVNNFNSGSEEQEEEDINPFTAYGTRWVDLGVTGSCPVTPAWSSTGNYRCVTVNGFMNGHQEQEQSDINPFTSYGTRWVDLGVTRSCPVEPSWEFTGNYRCVKVSVYNNGIEEQEQRDVNPFTGKGTRWVDLGVTGSCPVTPAWSATGNYRCVMYNGFYTGHQEQEERDLNPVTQNGTRWVDLGVTSSCPLSPAWTPTGNYRCVIIGGFMNGHQEQEQSDINPFTGYGTRWVDIGVTGSCAPSPVWQFQYSYCQSVSGNTGTLVTVYKDINPYSSTYNQYDYNYVYNPTACPVTCNALICPIEYGFKCVNGVCEYGEETWLYSYFNGTEWICVFRRHWSDGSEALFEQPDPSNTGSIDCGKSQARNNKKTKKTYNENNTLGSADRTVCTG